VRCAILFLSIAAGAADSGWSATVAYEGKSGFSGVAIGDADADSPGLEVAGASESGEIVLVRFPKGKPEATVLLRHGHEMTGLLVADIDPALPGAELYAGGSARGGDDNGVVFQFHFAGGKMGTRRLLETDGYVHAMARLDGDPPRLVVTTYSGRVLLATPDPDKWALRAIHEEPRDLGVEGLKIKDVRTGPFAGRPARTILFAAKSGRIVLLDPDDASKTELCRIEEGGVARLSDVDDGGIWVACNDGRLLRLDRDGAREVFRSSEALRGAVVGRFAVPGGEARLAVYGYDRVCRAIRVEGGDFPLFTDSERGHWLAAGDLVPGNGSDELALAILSGRILILKGERR
jgi:hypothetical protein